MEGGGDEEGSQDVIQTITNNGRSSSNLVHVDVKDGNLHSRICAFFFYHVRSSALFSLLEINARSNMNVIDIRLDQAVTRCRQSMIVRTHHCSLLLLDALELTPRGSQTQLLVSTTLMASLLSLTGSMH